MCVRTSWTDLIGCHLLSGTWSFLTGWRSVSDRLALDVGQVGRDRGGAEDPRCCVAPAILHFEAHPCAADVSPQCTQATLSYRTHPRSIACYERAAVICLFLFTCCCRPNVKFEQVFGTVYLGPCCGILIYSAFALHSIGVPRTPFCQCKFM